MRHLRDLNPIRPAEDDLGQTTAEYALVIAAVATVVGAMIAWAGGGPIEALFDAVVGNLTRAINGSGG